MTKLEKNIYQAIAASNGIKGSEIAKNLGVEKKLVNSTLYKSTYLKDRVIQDDEYRWKLKSKLSQNAQESQKSELKLVEFSNDTFSDSGLTTETKNVAAKTPVGNNPRIRWIDIHGTTIRPSSGSAYNAEEVQAIVVELKRLVSSGYKGTIGVTTPFRRQAEEVRRVLESKEKDLLTILSTRHEFIADTVHKFQVDERDLIIFSPVVSDGTPATVLAFLENIGNLFNVAITRARAVLIVVGNHGYCANSSVCYLSKFANYQSKISYVGHNKL